MKIERIFSNKEVLIIASIAAVIVLITIISVISIRSSRKDGNIRGDASRVLSSVQLYAGSHSGVYPTTGAPDINNFVSEFKLPTNYTYSYGNGPANASNQMIISNLNCDGNTGASVRFYLSNEGPICID